jgi:DNA-binding NtrC family response regulator
MGVQEKELSQEAIQELQNINWTGNIRELRNIIERLIILCGSTISGDDIVRYANPKK